MYRCKHCETPLEHSETCTCDGSRIDDLIAERDALVELLREYRDKTPLGHQPHMIAARADKLLSKARGDQ